LASTDEVKVARAILALSTAEQKAAVVFLRERLRPVRVDFERMNRLIADLDSEQFVRRQKAAAELEYLGGYAVPRLQRALSGQDSDIPAYIRALEFSIETRKELAEKDFFRIKEKFESADTKKTEAGKEPVPVNWKDAVAKGSFSGTPPLEVVRRIEELLERMTHPQTKLLKEKEQVVGEKERLKEQVAELEKELSESESAKKALEEKVTALVAQMRDAKDPKARKEAEFKLAELLRKADDPVLLRLAELLRKADDPAIPLDYHVRLLKLRSARLGYVISSLSLGSQDKDAADRKEGSEIVNDTLPPPAWLRAARAIAVLENIATPEARQLLESLAAGERDALPTREAKAALERLNKPVLPQ
jgi:hypothetical protein